MEDGIAALPDGGLVVRETPLVVVGPDSVGAGKVEWGGEEFAGGGGEEDVDGEGGGVAGVEGGEDEGELDGCDGAGAGEEEVEFVVVDVGEGAEGFGGGGGGVGGGGGCGVGGGGRHCWWVMLLRDSAGALR